MNLKSLTQDVLVAAAGAVVPLLPSLLDSPPAITLKELARMALSAAVAVVALYLKKHRPSEAS